MLTRAEGALERLARISEASRAEIDAAREAQNEALTAIRPARDLFDSIVSARAGATTPLTAFDETALSANTELPRAREFARELNALHFPIMFPEVFIRDRPGFDCILGNPPWEEASRLSATRLLGASGIRAFKSMRSGSGNAARSSGFDRRHVLTSRLKRTTAKRRGDGTAPAAAARARTLSGDDRQVDP